MWVTTSSLLSLLVFEYAVRLPGRLHVIEMTQRWHQLDVVFGYYCRPPACASTRQHSVATIQKTNL